MFRDVACLLPLPAALMRSPSLARVSAHTNDTRLIAYAAENPALFTCGALRPTRRMRVYGDGNADPAWEEAQRRQRWGPALPVTT